MIVYIDTIVFIIRFSTHCRDSDATVELHMHGVVHCVNSHKYRIYCVSDVSLTKQIECHSPASSGIQLFLYLSHTLGFVKLHYFVSFVSCNITR